MKVRTRDIASGFYQQKRYSPVAVRGMLVDLGRRSRADGRKLNGDGVKARAAGGQYTTRGMDL